MTEETVDPQVEVPVEQEMQEAAVAEADNEQQDVEQEAVKEEVVPLSTLIKERKKRQSIEQELEWEKQRARQYAQPKPEPEEDMSKYETATREDLSKTQAEAVRTVEERLWIRQNPDKFHEVNENLQEFLKQRPNLASAIGSSPNRWEEAYTLMTALSPKQQQQFKKPVPVKKEAPNSPASVPKAASMNEAVDVMNMSDQEFSAWRQAQKKRR